MFIYKLLLNAEFCNTCMLCYLLLISSFRLWHTACLGKDSDVIVFGGSQDYILLVDKVGAIRTTGGHSLSDDAVKFSGPLGQDATWFNNFK